MGIQGNGLTLMGLSLYMDDTGILPVGPMMGPEDCSGALDLQSNYRLTYGLGGSGLSFPNRLILENNLDTNTE